MSLHPYNEYKDFFIEVHFAQWMQEKVSTLLINFLRKGNYVLFSWVLIINIKKDGILEQN